MLLISLLFELAGLSNTDGSVLWLEIFHRVETHLNRSHSSKRLVELGGPIDFERRAEVVRVLSRGIKSGGILRETKST